MEDEVTANATRASGKNTADSQELVSRSCNAERNAEQRLLASLCGEWRDTAGSSYRLTWDKSGTTLGVRTRRPQGAEMFTKGLIRIQRTPNGWKDSVVWGSKPSFILLEWQYQDDRLDRLDSVLWGSNDRSRKSFRWKRCESADASASEGKVANIDSKEASQKRHVQAVWKRCGTPAVVICDGESQQQEVAQEVTVGSTHSVSTTAGGSDADIGTTVQVYAASTVIGTDLGSSSTALSLTAARSSSTVAPTEAGAGNRTPFWQYGTSDAGRESTAGRVWRFGEGEVSDTRLTAESVLNEEEWPSLGARVAHVKRPK